MVLGLLFLRRRAASENEAASTLTRGQPVSGWQRLRNSRQLRLHRGYFTLCPAPHAGIEIRFQGTRLLCHPMRSPQAFPPVLAISGVRRQLNHGCLADEAVNEQIAIRQPLQHTATCTASACIQPSDFRNTACLA